MTVPEERERWAEAQQREKDEMGIRLSNLGWGDEDETTSSEATLNEDAEELFRWCNAHGSIRVQEGEPN